MADDDAAAPAVDPALVRMLDALRRGSDPGVFRGVAVPVDDDGEPVPAEPPVEPPTEPPAAPPALPPAEPSAVRFDVSPLLARHRAARLPLRVDVSAWGPRAWSRLEDLRHRRPPNWPADRPAGLLDAVASAARDGVAVVGAPRAAVVAPLLAARDRAERVAVLLAREPEVLADCREVLAAVVHPALAGQRWLTGRALDALGDGHPEAARALAAACVDAAVAEGLTGPRAAVVQQALLDPDLERATAEHLRAALAPVVTTTAHADPVRSGRGDAVVAVLLAASVLRALQELCELADAAAPLPG